VTYLVARHLSFYRGEHYARLIAKPEELQPILDAACSLASGTATQGQDSERLLAEIRAHAKEAELGLLPRLGPHLARAKHPLDLAGWLRAVEITAARAGFLLCGDLAAAARIGAAEPSIQRVGLSAERLVRELLLFSVSEEYFRLRAHLGIDVKAS